MKISRRNFLTGTATLAGIAATASVAPITIANANHSDGKKGLPGFISWKDRNALIIHSDKGIETHRSAIGESLITPNRNIYIRNNMPTMTDEQIGNRMDWKVSIEGVKNPKTFTIAQLQKLGHETMATILQCSGNGRSRISRKLAVTIPAGIEDNSKIRIRNQGDSGLKKGQEGDLYVSIQVTPHEKFERIASDIFSTEEINIAQAALGDSIKVSIKTDDINEVIKSSDFITLHVPAQKDYVIGKEEFAMMKDGSAIINAARGGVIDEAALVNSLDNGKLAFACLDTYENEPKPEIKLLMHPRISLTPHIGAATLEAQDRIGLELASQIKSILS